jgi:arylsulfatase A-like enzyme
VLIFVKQATGQPQPPPNIVVINTDDQDVASVVSMHNVQAYLVAEGLSFTNGFVTTPHCVPSRVSLLRGQYAHNHGVQKADAPEGAFDRFYVEGHEHTTVATWHQESGYRTALVGKYVNLYPGSSELGLTWRYIPPGWDEWYARISFTSPFYDYTMNENGELVTYGNTPDDYLTDVEADKAIDFLGRALDDRVPFFLYLAPFAPHARSVQEGGTPPEPAVRHLQDYPEAKIPRVPSFNEALIDDKPQWVRDLPLLTSLEIEELDAHHRMRLQSLSAIDEMLGRMVQLLEQRHALAQTFIFFTSDNGFHLGEHRLPAMKHTAYDEALRVPLFVRGPGVPQGEQRPHLALNIDLAPTIAELAGVDVPEFVDGRSLAPVLTGNPVPTADWRQLFLVEFWPNSDRFPVPAYYALRSTTNLYVQWSTGESEVYDLRVDPYALSNYSKGIDASTMFELTEAIDRLAACAGVTCRALDGLQVMDIEVPVENLPREGPPRLSKVYPNPFNRRAHVTLQAPYTEPVRVEVFDLFGRRLEVLYDGIMQAGEEKTFFLEAERYSSGVLIYRVQAGRHAEAGTAVLVK